MACPLRAFKPYLQNGVESRWAEEFTPIIVPQTVIPQYVPGKAPGPGMPAGPASAAEAPAKADGEPALPLVAVPKEPGLPPPPPRVARAKSSAHLSEAESTGGMSELWLSLSYLS